MNIEGNPMRKSAATAARVSFFSALAALVCVSSEVTRAAASAVPDLPGHWTGVAHDSAGGFHADSLVDFEIRNASVGLELVDHDRARNMAAPVALTVRGRTFRAQYTGLWPNPVQVSGRLAADGRSLEVLLTHIGMTGKESQHATLHQADTAARSFEAPRVDGQGARVLDYVYAPPQPANDGIPVASASQEGIDPTPLAALVKSILAQTGVRERAQTEGVLVLRHGKLVFEEYFWGQSAGNPHIISSCTKSVTSILTGIAADQGQLRVDDPVVTYFPAQRDSLWGRARQPITVRNVLSMSAGTAWDDSVTGPANPSWQLLESHDVPAYVLSRPMVHPPGSFYNYDNGLPTLMGFVVARVTREPYERFAERTLFAPLGISNYRWTLNPDGTPLAAGGLYLRPRDMAKIGLLMLDRGRWQGHQILSSAWVAESTQQQTAADQYPYGYYWHLTNAKHRHVKNVDGYMALGQGGQVIAVFPSLQLVVVITSQNWAMRGPTSMPFSLMDDFILPAVDAAAPGTAAAF